MEEISQYAMKGINKAWTGETKSPDVDFHFRFVCSRVAGVDFLLGSSLAVIRKTDIDIGREGCQAVRLGPLLSPPNPSSVRN